MQFEYDSGITGPLGTKGLCGAHPRHQQKPANPSQQEEWGGVRGDLTETKPNNMINIATESICKYITAHVAVESYLLRSNFSSEKKASGVNLSSVYGKEVVVESVIPRRIVQMFLSTTPDAIAKAWHSWALGSIHAGMLGLNAQLANGLAALYLACGQDIAHIANASVGINMFELLDDGNF